MKHKHILATLLGVLLTTYALAQPAANYYDNDTVNNKSGNNLRTSLQIIIDEHIEKNYDDLENYYPSIDHQAGNTNLVWDIYSTCSFTFNNANCSQNAVCDCWNKEHTVPQSWFNEASPMKSDLHHVLPTDARVNNFRSNYAYGIVANHSSPVCNDDRALGWRDTGKGIFEPVDQYKGDIARIYFYMATRYADQCSNWSGGMFGSDKNGFTTATAEMLIQWHRQDPVSQKEIDRNNGIQAVQGNRNPFVDYPCLAEYIWGNKVGEAFNTANCCGSFESGFAGDGCTACGNTTPPTDPSISVNPASITITTAPGSSKTATITITGSNLTADIAINVSGEGFSADKTSLTTTGGTVTITFAPTAEGTINGTLTLTSGSVTKTVVLTGNGMASNAITPPQPAPAAGPFLMVGDPIIVENVKQTDITCTGTTTLQLNIANLVQNATISSSNTSVFTVSPTSVSPAEAAAGVQVTITKVTNGSGTLTIIAGPVTRTVTVSCQ